MTIKKNRLITLKQYRLIVASTMIIMASLSGWAAHNGYAWLPAPVMIAGSIILGLLRMRVKELRVDERSNSIDEKSMAIAWLIFIFLAGTSGLTLLALGRDTPDFLQAIGWTLLLSGCAIAIFFFIAKLFVSRKMGGKA
jgi:uncharacterized membrane protein